MIRLDHCPGRGIGIAVLAAFLAACAHQTGTVVLLPEKDGRSTSVTVMQGNEQIVLDQPYAAVRQTSSGMNAYVSNAQEVQALFGAALAAQPSRPTSFTLYFIEGKDTLTDESKQLVETSLAEIGKRPVPDVLVVGHTDLVGSHPTNDALSRQRAPHSPAHSFTIAARPRM